MRIELGVPDRASERAMLLGVDRRQILKELKPVFSAEKLREIQVAVECHASAALLDYLQDLLDASRNVTLPAYRRAAALALLHAAQSWALMHGREMVLPRTSRRSRSR
jgi:MoxR-like ATPase